jgi:hypothetical protein
MTTPPPPTRPLAGRPGDLIDLTWAEPPTAWYVRGHVPEDQAIATVRELLEAEAEDGDRDHVPELGLGGYGWARWGMGQDEHGDQVQRQFYAPAKPGPGAFKITEVIDRDHLASLRAARQAEADHRAELEAWTLACYPEATEIRAHGYPPGAGHVRFKLPELLGDVYRSATETTVQIQRRDLETWERLYGPQPEAPRRLPTFAAFLLLATLATTPTEDPPNG